MPESEQKPIQTAAPYTASYYSSLLAGLIHKLNNVATVLTGNTGLLLMDESLPAKVRESLEQMTKAIHQLTSILDEAAIAGKGGKLNLEPVDVTRVISSMEVPIALELNKNGPALVTFDPAKLRAIFQEICRNAISAGATKIRCQIERASEGYLVRFRDNGSGIKKELMPRIFDPFFTTKRFPDAFGLGLFRAAGELARSSGTLSIASDGESFTEVCITLPGSSG